MPPNDFDSLLPGDVLLMRSAGEFSELVAWLGETEYSHSGLYAGDGIVIEAITKGVESTPLSALIADDSVLCIDAFRGTAHDGSVMSAEDRSSVIACARGYLDTDFAKSRLVLLGAISAVRKKLPLLSVGVSGIVMLGLRLFRDSQVREVVCSELVYRSFLECDVDPEGRVRPRIMRRVPNPLPEPDIDVKKLKKEIRHILGWKENALLADAELEALMAPVTQDELEALHAEVRAQMDLDQDEGFLPEVDKGGPPREIMNPLPRMVRPRDLEVSPSLSPHATLK